MARPPWPDARAMPEPVSQRPVGGEAHAEAERQMRAGTRTAARIFGGGRRARGDEGLGVLG